MRTSSWVGGGRRKPYPGEGPPAEGGVRNVELQGTRKVQLLVPLYKNKFEVC